jgi:uridine phosphorylase
LMVIEHGYLRPTAPIAAEALLVADPGLAMALAQVVLCKPVMANHHHGLWGYSGMTAGDRALTVQSTGIGGPSTAAVAAELAAHGVTRAIRVGRCTALDPALDPGSVVVVDGALGLDGTSTALGVDRPAPDEALTAALTTAVAATRAATVAGYDLAPVTAPQALRDSWRADGATIADGETAALIALGARDGLAVAAALIVDAGDDEALVALAERAALAFAQLG